MFTSTDVSWPCHSGVTGVESRQLNNNNTTIIIIIIMAVFYVAGNFK